MAKRISNFAEPAQKKDKKDEKIDAEDLKDEFPLNEDCVRFLIKYLPLQDLKSLRLSCKTLNRIVMTDKRFRVLAILVADFFRNPDVFKPSFTELPLNFRIKLPALTHLSVKKNLGTLVFKFVENFKDRIEEVEINHSSPDLLQKIVPELKMVKKLSWFYCMLYGNTNEGDLSLLIHQNAPRLQTLELRHVSGDNFTLTEDLPNLTTLKLDQCKDIVISKLWTHITQLKKLCFVEDLQYEPYADASFTNLINKNGRTLEILELEGVYRNSFFNVTHVTNLAYLKLVECAHYELTPIIRSFANSLEHLSLNSMNESIFVPIPLVKLKTLVIDGSIADFKNNDKELLRMIKIDSENDQYELFF